MRVLSGPLHDVARGARARCERTYAAGLHHGTRAGRALPMGQEARTRARGAAASRPAFVRVPSMRDFDAPIAVPAARGLGNQTAANELTQPSPGRQGLALGIRQPSAVNADPPRGGGNSWAPAPTHRAELGTGASGTARPASRAPPGAAQAPTAAEEDVRVAATFGCARQQARH